MEKLDPKEFVSSLFSTEESEDKQSGVTPVYQEKEVKRKSSSVSLNLDSRSLRHDDDGQSQVTNSSRRFGDEDLTSLSSIPASPTKKFGNSLIIELAPGGGGQACVPSDCGIRVHRSNTPSSTSKSSPSCSRSVSILPLNDVGALKKKSKPVARAASFSFSTPFATIGRKLGVKNKKKPEEGLEIPPARGEPPSPSLSLLQSVTSVATLPRKKNKIRRPGPFSVSVPSPLLPHQPLYGNIPPQEYSRNCRGISRCSSAMAPYCQYDELPTPPPQTSFDDSPTPTLHRLLAHSPSSSPIPPRLVEMLDEPVDEDCGVAAERVTWEYHHVTLQRIPGYGFGIAVSGGRDNPHFTNGDPAIAISDVLKGGPAEGKLQVNDRVLSANNVPLENVDYNTAVQVLRDSGAAVSLVVKRRIIIPGGDPLTMKVTLTKGKKKEDFGIVLGCRIYIKEITNKALLSPSEGGPAIQEGDVVLRINSQPTDNLSLKEAKKLLEQAKEKLQLVLKRDKAEQTQVPGGPVVNGHIENGVNGQDPSASPYQHHYSTQNLYVQSPTRHGSADMRSPNSQFRSLDDKSNLTRQSGRSRGPIMDLAVGSLDGEDAPPRPPPPRPDDYFVSRGRTYPEENPRSADTRVIKFRKDGGSVGIRLTGGNETGVFVSAVQPGSQASLQGLQAGDKILKANGTDVKGATREEAVLMLMSLQDSVELLVQHRREEYDQVLQSGKGDLFYIKAHFNHEGGTKGEMGFKKGEVFKVIDTLYNGVVGQWQVARLGATGQEIQRGVIPNNSTAEEMATAQFNAVKKEQTVSDSSSKSFFRRRRTNGRRSKSLGKDHWDDVVFAESLSKFPAYERVTLKHPGFVRPVVLFGPIADIGRNRLLADYPDKFSSPQVDSGRNDENDETKMNKSGIVRLSAIRTILESGRHALLDITPSAVDKLNYAQFYPIVVFLKTDSKPIVKELRSSLPKTAHRSTKKLMEQSQKLERLWSHLFTTNIVVTSADTWYKRVREAIEREQNQAVWMSENKLDNYNLADDFLFPMNTRLSYASSPESDADLSPEPRSPNPDTAHHHRLMRSNSDPSLVSPEEVPGNFGSPPSYPRSPTKPPPPEEHRRGDRESKYGFVEPSHPSRTPNHNMPSRNSLGATGHRQSSHRDGPPLPEPPPKIDRASKPRMPERGFPDSGPPDSGAVIRGASMDRDSRDQKTASYGSTSSQEAYPRLPDPSSRGASATSPRVSREPSEPSRYPSERGQDRGRSSTKNPDPYRYSRSSTNPPPQRSPSQERALNGNYGTYDYKPSPPPKNGTMGPPTTYKPVPPPKPKNYNRPGPLPLSSNGDPTSTYWTHSSPSTSSNPKSPVPPRSYDNYYNSYNNYQKYEEDSAGFDSGHGSSLDRQSYGGLSVQPPSANTKNQYYYNVPPRDARGIDLQHRDQRGSAFELYRKPSYPTQPGYSLEANGRPSPSDTRSPSPQSIVAVAEGCFSSAGGVLESRESGVSLHIPPGALPPGVKQQIFFKVCRDTALMPPLDVDKGEQLLSPLVMCGPHGLKFLRPIELRLPHRPVGTSNRWSVALKSGATEEFQADQENKWRHLSLPPDLTAAGEGKVTVLVDHF